MGILFICGIAIGCRIKIGTESSHGCRPLESGEVPSGDGGLCAAVAQANDEASLRMMAACAPRAREQKTLLSLGGCQRGDTADMHPEPLQQWHSSTPSLESPIGTQIEAFIAGYRAL